MPRPYDIEIDFHIPDPALRTSGYLSLSPTSAAPTVGSTVTAGDGEGGICPATVLDVLGDEVVLQLRMDEYSYVPESTT